jgi:hypothetical protein
MSERSELKRVVLASAASPVNLGVLGVAVAVALALAVMGVGGAGVGAAVLTLGVLAYGALMALDLTSPKFVAKVTGGGPRVRVAEIEKVEPQVMLDQIRPQELRAIYQMILTNYQRTVSAYEGSSDSLKQSLSDSLARCGQLVNEAGRTAVKGNALRNYLELQTAQSIEAEAQSLEESARQAKDEKAAATYQKAAASAREQLATYRQIEGLYDRVKAQLAAIETSTDGVYAKIVKLQATDLQEAILVNQSIAEHLDALSSDMHILESVVEETIQEIAP